MRFNGCVSWYFSVSLEHKMETPLPYVLYTYRLTSTTTLIISLDMTETDTIYLHIAIVT